MYVGTYVWRYMQGYGFVCVVSNFSPPVETLLKVKW